MRQPDGLGSAGANVIDYIADTPQQLLAILDGKSVAMQGGARILKTENAIVLDRSPDWRARFINLLTNPISLTY